MTPVLMRHRAECLRIVNIDSEAVCSIRTGLPALRASANIHSNGARVGTVDKFQGQEAQAVLISMVTSSGEELPRNIEFLYSRNRLNVAISRARSLAVILASPQLVEIQCNSVEQMRLVNTLCWAWKYAERNGAVDSRA